MIYYYRQTRCTFRQFLSAYLSCAIALDDAHERRIIALAEELAHRWQRCMAPTQEHADRVKIDTAGQVKVEFE